MSGEALFKSIVSGENRSILGDIARSSLASGQSVTSQIIPKRSIDAGNNIIVTVPVIQCWEYYCLWV